MQAASPRAHVPAAVGGVVAQTVQQRAVDLGHVPFAHGLIRGPFCSHTDSLTDPGIEAARVRASCRPFPSLCPSSLMGFSSQDMLRAAWHLQGRLSRPAFLTPSPPLLRTTLSSVYSLEGELCPALLPSI